MNKILRYSFVALMAMVFGNIYAEETVDFTAQGYTSGSEVASYQGTNITIAFAGNGASNAPKYYSTGTAIRMYAKNSMTITSTKTIKTIKFTLSNDGLINDNNKSFSVGDYDMSTTEWTGSTTELVVTNAATSGNQIRIQKMVFYFEGDEIPTIDPNAKGQKNNPYLLTDAEFISLVNSLNTDAKPKSDEVYVKGFITNIEEVNTTYGNATFKIAAVKADYDADMKLKAFRCNYLEKAKFTSEDQIKKDDEVVVCGQIQWYGEGDSKAPQINQGCYIYSLNGATTNINTIKTDADVNAPAYNLAGQKVEKNYKGVVIMNGKKMIQK